MEADFVGSSCDLEAAFDAQQDPNAWPGYEVEVSPRLAALMARPDFISAEEAAAIAEEAALEAATWSTSPCGCAVDAEGRPRLTCHNHSEEAAALDYGGRPHELCPSAWNCPRTA